MNTDVVAVVVELLNHDWLFATLWTAACQAALSFTVSQGLVKFMSIELVMISNHFILCLLLLPLIFPSISVFSSASALCIRWPKFWSFNFSISPSSEYSGLISYRIDWFDLMPKSLLQHNSKASVLLHSAFFMLQLSPPYMSTGKTTALTRLTFVGKIIPPLFNMLSRLVIAFLPKSTCLLISWLQSTICSGFGAPKNKTCHCFHFPPLPFAMKWWDQTPWSSFIKCWLLNSFSLSSYTKRLFSSSSLSVIRVLSFAYRSYISRLLVFLSAILIPACASSSPAFRMMCSAYKLNKQGDNIQPCPMYSFPKFESISCSMSGSNCCFLTCIPDHWKSLHLFRTLIFLEIFCSFQYTSFPASLVKCIPKYFILLDVVINGIILLISFCNSSLLLIVEIQLGFLVA